jgi:hypothetical protein
MAVELDVLFIAFLRVSLFSSICRDLPVAQALFLLCLLSLDPAAHRVSYGDVAPVLRSIG